MGTRHVTLTASTVRNVSVSHGDPVTDVIVDAPDRTIYPTMETLEVMNVSGSSIVYFTYAFGAGFEQAASAGILPATPTIAGPDTIAVPAVAGAFVHIDAPDERNVAVVRAISAGTPQISVSTVRTDRGTSDDGGSSGGGVKDFATAAVTGGNGSGGNGSYSAVTNLASLVLDAAAGDLIGVDLNAVLFGPQSFFRVAAVGGTTVVTVAGWYRSTDLTNQGSACSAEFKFIAAAGDIVGGQVTLQLQAQGTGNNPLILEGSQFQATNYGAPA